MTHPSQHVIATTRGMLKKAGRFGLQIDEAADLSGYSRETVSKALRELYRAGEVTRERALGVNTGSTFRYFAGGSPMRALSLWQPWASLIAFGLKMVETRSWGPASSAIGDLLAIHASAKLVRGYKLHRATETAMIQHAGLDWADTIPRRAVVAVCRLADAFEVVGHTEGHQGRTYALSEPMYPDDLGQSPLWAKAASGRRHRVQRAVPVTPHGDYAVGRWLWLLDTIRPLTAPAPMNGRQMIWACPDEAVEGLLGDPLPINPVATGAWSLIA